jgi:hypothetical protein
MAAFAEASQQCLPLSAPASCPGRVQRVALAKVRRYARGHRQDRFNQLTTGGASACIGMLSGCSFDTETGRGGFPHRHWRASMKIAGAGMSGS